MLKANFRSLFVFFLLTNMFLGQVAPIDRSLALLEYGEALETSLGEAENDKSDGTLSQSDDVIGPVSWSVNRSVGHFTTHSSQFAAVFSARLANYAPRAPPFII